MAVQNPCARIVGLEGNGEIASRWEHGHVAAGCFVELKASGRCVWIVFRGILSNDGEVMALTLSVCVVATQGLELFTWRCMGCGMANF